MLNIISDKEHTDLILKLILQWQFFQSILQSIMLSLTNIQFCLFQEGIHKILSLKRKGKNLKNRGKKTDNLVTHINKYSDSLAPTNSSQEGLFKVIMGEVTLESPIEGMQLCLCLEGTSRLQLQVNRSVFPRLSVVWRRATKGIMLPLNVSAFTSL